MKVVVVGHGGRGDVEPCVAAGRELVRRGHDVLVAVPPNMLEFVESAGLDAVAYGADSREDVKPAAELVRDFDTQFHSRVGVLTAVVEHVTKVKADKTATLRAVTQGAHLLVAG